MEHEQWSRTFNDLTALQLEKAQDDAKFAEVQLKSAEEYMCAIMHTIRSNGFTIELIDSHTATVAKTHDRKFPNILCCNYELPMHILETYTISVSGSPAISLLLD
jgi:hypothetical protein